VHGSRGRHAPRLGRTLVALSLCLIACDVYDSQLLHRAAPASAGHSTQPGLQAGRGSGNEEDAGSEGRGCMSQDDPACPLLCDETCNGADDDCDGMTDEGNPCSLPSATSVCTRDGCLIASCEGGRVDCNELAADGCEATLDSLDNCGICRNRCELPNAEPACEDGKCVVRACAEGYADCNGRADDGCERSLTTPSDCGACGATCQAPHAAVSCSTGSCRFLRCSPGWGDCNGDANRLSDGDGCETDLTRPEHCGRCGTRCSGDTPYCSNGKCSALGCPADAADCDGDNISCETNVRSVEHCGGCDSPCEQTFAHAVPSCSQDGQCVPSCDAGWKSCDQVPGNGCETDVRTTGNCGDCGVTCSFANAAATCSEGRCQLDKCNSGYGDCNDEARDGCEARLNSNAHCAACGRACSELPHASASCSSGSCQVTGCAPGYGNCDGLAANGCEVDLNSNSQHCSGCNQPCPSGLSCRSGRCTCTKDSDCRNGRRCCNGSCEDVASDERHCGSCGNVCAEGETCCSGRCTDLASDVDNCGRCGDSCGVDSNRCSNGRCRCGNDLPCSLIESCCGSGCRLFLCF